MTAFAQGFEVACDDIQIRNSTFDDFPLSNRMFERLSKTTRKKHYMNKCNYLKKGQVFLTKLCQHR